MIPLDMNLQATVTFDFEVTTDRTVMMNIIWAGHPVSFELFQVVEAKLAFGAPLVIMVGGDCGADVDFQLFWEVERLVASAGRVETRERGRIEVDQDPFIWRGGLLDIGVQIQWRGAFWGEGENWR